MGTLSRLRVYVIWVISVGSPQICGINIPNPL